MLQSRMGIIAGVILLVLAGWGVHQVRTVTKPPSIAIPPVLDLGEQEQGQILHHEFVIGNSGGKPLQISDVRTNCSCSGLERVVDGTFEPIEELTIAPGESIPVQVRLTVRGIPGQEFRTGLFFTTNDPKQTTCAIAVLVTRVLGFASEPPAVILGESLVGNDLTRLVRVRDLTDSEFEIESITTSHPKLLSARKVDQELRSSFQVEIIAQTRAPATINGEVRIGIRTSKGSKTIVVPVNGKVSSPVEVSPSRLYLPRASDQGPVYRATCVCRSNVDGPLEIFPAQTAPGLEVKVQESPVPAATRLLTIVWQPHAPGASVGEHVVSLIAKTRKREYPIQIIVNCGSNDDD